MKKSKHNLSYYRLLTGDMGELMPVGLTEVLPGDTFRHSSTAFVRFSPMQAPVMHPIRVRLHHFFVPHRLSWPGPTEPGDHGSFEDFITGGPDGKNAVTVPTLDVRADEDNGILQYQGVPFTVGTQVSRLPVYGYNMIYNEFFRDQDLAPERGLATRSLAKVAWEKDYFSTARPWPQKGEEVTLPLGTSAPVVGLGKINQNFTDGTLNVYESGSTGVQAYASSARMQDNTNDEFAVEQDPNNAGHPGIFADLSRAAAAKVNDIRRAFALQRFAENRARFGSRYAEYVRFLGGRPADSRIDRPEYLGGGTTTASISEVLQTSNESTDARVGVGDMYGHGIALNKGNAYRKTFQEHGYVHTLMSVRPKALYTEGVERHWLRQDREDFFQPELQFIGQQEILNQEVFADATNPRTVFGWADRYAEYRQSRSLVTGEFKDKLKYWHLARDFETLPPLGSGFVNCNPSKRIFSEQTQHSMWISVNHKLIAQRAVSKNASGRLF